jgi:hypothetical protein
MSIQHKDIPDAQLHQPKGISTAAVKTLYFANGTGAGAWRRSNDLDMDYSVKANNKFGWNDIADSLYTVAGPRTILSGVRTQLTNNGAAAQSDTSRLGLIWDTALNQFLLNDLNALYTLRVNFKVKAAAAAGTPYIVTLEVQSNNGPTVIGGDTRLVKGGSAVNQISMTQGFYNGSFINNQPVKLFLTPDTDITLYDIGFVVQRTYIEV